MLDEIVEKQDTVALLGAALADGKEACKPAPCGAILRIPEDVRRAINEDEPGSNRDLDRPLRFALILRSRRRMGTHNTGNRIAVRDADTRKPEFTGTTDQFFRMRAAAQKRKIRGDGKLRISRNVRIVSLDASYVLRLGRGVNGAHANRPCRNQIAGVPA